MSRAFVWVGEHPDHGPFLPARARPHPGQTRFITGSSNRMTPTSKYTRWWLSPNTRSACPQPRRYTVRSASKDRSDGAIRVPLVIAPPPTLEMASPSSTSAGRSSRHAPTPQLGSRTLDRAEQFHAGARRRSLDPPVAQRPVTAAAVAFEAQEPGDAERALREPGENEPSVVR